MIRHAYMYIIIFLWMYMFIYFLFRIGVYIYYILFFVIGQSVETFVPPKKSDLKSKLKWNDAVSEMLSKIKQIKTGGESLRIAIKSEITTLQMLRIDLFCKHVK